MLPTDRLILRRWQKTDLEPFASMNSDARVMEFFPKQLSYEESFAFVDRIERGFEENKFGLWALALKDNNQFIGFAGLNKPLFDAFFTPCVEVGWRIAHEHWGRGYAPEAAMAAVHDGFERLGLSEIVSFTAAVNLRSIRVMQKLKMTRDPDEDFLHPSLPPDHKLCPHVLFRLKSKVVVFPRPEIEVPGE
jgi:RimJ/RimL family protein N-acetyltransferase